ncbi:universal stress protein UspA [Streptomyces variegatus]|uniref:Universal stress protein UspA n=1 Tax=Streptomyces variegatus TaxID=284040 RepID=A0A0M2GYQ2_9ACTN|nr:MULTISPECIES: universal stress protein [Streptomyces]KJK40804.1 universal stress protein UspA [Streptomyces variegatus]
MSGLVVVGVDGSTSSLAAVEVAAREARLRGAGLRVVHAFVVWPATHVPLGPPPLEPPEPPEGGLRDMAHRLVTEAVERARTVAPDVDTSHVVVTAEPVTALEAQSRAAELVVVGSRGMGGFVGLLAGSTAVHLAAHGSCPVLVVREQPHADGPIVVGVDGSAAGQKAVDFAFAEAALRDAPLVAQHAWTTWNAPMPAPQDKSMPYANPPGALAEEEERLLSEALAGRQERYPGVTVEHKVVHGGTRESLIEASRSAQLVVVGARGRGGFSGLLLGSVSQALLHHAHCPVAVVRGAVERH